MDDDGIDREKLKEMNRLYGGRFVCYDAVDGSACWGRIKEVVYVNSQKGLMLAFVLNDRYVKYRAGLNQLAFLRFHPQGIQGPPKEHYRIREVRGDSILRFDQIDLEENVVDLEDEFNGMNSDELFFLYMKGKEEAEKNSARDIGVNSLKKSGEYYDRACKVLATRLQEMEDGQGNAD